MEAVQVQEQTEEIQLPYTNAAQAMARLQRAAAILRWYPMYASSHSLAYYVSYAASPAGDVVTLTLTATGASLHARPENEYYYEYEQKAGYAALLQKALAQVAAEEEKAERNMHPMHRERYGALVPSRTYKATPAILYINVLVFLLMVLAGLSPLHPTARDLFNWGGNLPAATTHGHWWRLLTYMFLHGGAMHLLMNAFGLLYIGMFLEPLIGRLRFLSAYIFTGVCAGLMSMVFHPASVCVGASGAIFGMYGVFLAVLTTGYIQRSTRRTMLRSLLLFVVYGLLAGMEGNTDNAAHVGGLLSGIIIGYAYYPGLAAKAPISGQARTTGILAAAVSLLAAASIAFLR